MRIETALSILGEIRQFQAKSLALLSNYLAAEYDLVYAHGCYNTI